MSTSSTVHGVDAESAAVVLGRGEPQLMQTFHREVVLLVGIVAQRPDYRCRHRKWRLAQSQLEHAVPLAQELVGVVVDRNGGRGREAVNGRVKTGLTEIRAVV